jgi:hypothetical protein
MRRCTVFCPHVAVPLLLAMVAVSAEPATLRVSAADEPKPSVAPEKGEKAESPPREIPPRVRPIGHEFMTALALWCGILVIGLALLTMIVVWGRSLRALARRKPTPPTAPDPLWYLKTKPPPPPTPASSASTESSRDGDDGEPGSESSNRKPL